MRNLSNVEMTGRSRGQYKGHGGGTWSIRRFDTFWRATRYGCPQEPRAPRQRLEAPTLVELSELLSRYRENQNDAIMETYKRRKMAGL